jgi:hypothetical protein
MLLYVLVRFFPALCVFGAKSLPGSSRTLGCVVLVIFYVLFQWFLRATDITISYNWTQEGAGGHPNFNIRNRSRSTTYLLANIEYRKHSDGQFLHIDNDSIWDKELKPGSIRFLRVAPVKQITSLRDCEGVRVSVRHTEW